MRRGCEWAELDEVMSRWPRASRVCNESALLISLLLEQMAITEAAL